MAPANKKPTGKPIRKAVISALLHGWTFDEVAHKVFQDVVDESERSPLLLAACNGKHHLTPPREKRLRLRASSDPTKFPKNPTPKQHLVLQTTGQWAPVEIVARRSKHRRKESQPCESAPDFRTPTRNSPSSTETTDESPSSSLPETWPSHDPMECDEPSQDSTPLPSEEERPSLPSGGPSPTESRCDSISSEQPQP